MTFRSSDSRGFTLVEVLLVSSLFLVVLGATLTSFTNSERSNRNTQVLNEQVENARRGLDQAARQLRNLAKRPGSEPVIARVNYDDFIFQTSDPSRTWVRYCQEPRVDGTTRLWEQQTTATTAPTDTACPGNWPAGNLVASRVVNQAHAKRTFTFLCSPRAVSTCPRSGNQTDLTQITAVIFQIMIDLDRNAPPAPVQVNSAVYLRNQNEDPTAAFTWSPAGPGRITFNASASSDPEGRTLRYFWFVGSVPSGFNCLAGPPAGSDFFTGVLVTRNLSDLGYAAGSRPVVHLAVCDPGDRGAQTYQEVIVP